MTAKSYAELGPSWQIQQMKNARGALDCLNPENLPKEVKAKFIEARHQLELAIVEAEHHLVTKGPWR